MNRMLLKRLFACAAFALTASETLPAAELTHRWSFNGDYADAVSGADAVKCGTYVSLYGGKVHMGYGECSHGTGYVDLETSGVGPLEMCNFRRLVCLLLFIC